MRFDVSQYTKNHKSDITTEFRTKTTHVVIKATKISNKTINNINSYVVSTRHLVDKFQTHNLSTKR